MNTNYSLWLLNQYPLTIIADRYSGTYSGGEFTAWAEYPQNIPKEAMASDITCGLFWVNTDFIVGRGSNPNAAVEDLINRIEKTIGFKTEDLRDKEDAYLRELLN